MGIDVSHYQGEIDWPAVKAAGHSFAFCKAADGAIGRDPLFLRNWHNMRAAGVIRGAYHYLRIQQNAAVQAGIFAAILHGNGYDQYDLPPVCDFEDRPGAQAMGATATIRALETFVENVHRITGRVPIIYCDPDFWRHYGSPDFGGCHLWAADYSSINPKDKFAGWEQWAFWQYSSAGHVPGVAGPVDLDYWHSTPADLQAWIANNAAGR